MSADGDAAEGGAGPADRALVPLRWPPDSAGDPAEDIAARCSTCGQSWSVHRDLAGYRLRCRCGAWLEVARAEALPTGDEASSKGSEKASDKRAAVLDPGSSSTLQAPQTPGAVAPVPRDMRGLLLFAPPDGRTRVDPTTALPAGDLVEARNAVRQAWTTRMFLELGLVFAALLGPWLVLALCLEGRQQVVFQPLASLASCFLVMGVALLAPGYTYAALVRARARHYLEALGGALVALGCAALWMYMLRNSVDATGNEDIISPLRQEAGLGMALFVVAFCPGVFEEIAFRGLLQGRISALFGRSQGIVLTGVAFALAHGVTVAFPIHVGLGLYLCWLRERAGSLLPGMLLHVLYNGTLVILT